MILTSKRALLRRHCTDARAADHARRDDAAPVARSRNCSCWHFAGNTIQ